MCIPLLFFSSVVPFFDVLTFVDLKFEGNMKQKHWGTEKY